MQSESTIFKGSPTAIMNACEPYHACRNARIAVFLLLTIFGTGIDLWSKFAVFQWRGLPGELPPWWIVENYVGIETAVNLGALFGMGQGYSSVFGLLAVAAMIGIPAWLFYFGACESRWITTSMGLVSGGILGNLYDRMNMSGLQSPYQSGVRDWILFRFGEYTWPNFNIADSLLVVGAMMLALHSLVLAPREVKQGGAPK